MHLCSSFLAIPQLSSSWLYYLCAYPHQFLPLALFLLLLLSLEHLFSLGTSSFSDVLFPSHSLGWSASLSPPILLSLSSSWLSVSPFSCVLPFINSFEGLLEDFSAAQVSAVASWIQWNTLLLCCHFSPYLSTSTLLPKRYHAIITFFKTYRISKFDCQLSVSFSTSMFFHRQIHTILQSMLFTYISFLVHFHLSWFISTVGRSIYGD